MLLYEIENHCQLKNITMAFIREEVQTALQQAVIERQPLDGVVK